MRQHHPSNWYTGEEYVEPPEFDFHCPLMGAGLNTYRHKCEESIDNPHRPGCKPNCNVKEAGGGQPSAVKIPDEVKALATTLIIGGHSRQEVARHAGLPLNAVDRLIRKLRDAGRITVMDSRRKEA